MEFLKSCTISQLWTKFFLCIRKYLQFINLLIGLHDMIQSSLEKQPKRTNFHVYLSSLIMQNSGKPGFHRFHKYKILLYEFQKFNYYLLSPHFKCRELSKQIWNCLQDTKYKSNVWNVYSNQACFSKRKKSFLQYEKLM